MLFRSAAESMVGGHSQGFLAHEIGIVGVLSGVEIQTLQVLDVRLLPFWFSSDEHGE